MSEKPISPLRRRMIEDMMVRNFVEKTRNDYIRQVRTFTAFLGRSPDRAAPEDLRRFQLHQSQSGVRPPSMNNSVAALRFFFTITLDRPEMARHLTFVREPRKIPVVLSLEEVARLLEAAPGPKYKAALSAAYGAGLRVSEVVSLKVSDVDSKRMLLRIEQGKSLPPRRRGAARIALRCSLQSYWSCCATGIASPDRRSGYSPDVILCCR
jgi:integrase/recombinase XerD